MFKRQEMSDPNLTSWGEPEFVWWPYVLMLVWFVLGILVGLAF